MGALAAGQRYATTSDDERRALHAHAAAQHSGHNNV